MSTAVLLLNMDYKPIKVITWERAITLILDERAEMVEAYVGRWVRSVSDRMEWPAVVRLTTYVRNKARIRFNRQNVLARDAYQCAYCGIQPRTKQGTPDLYELTLDHVIPRAQSKGGTVKAWRSGSTIAVTCWQNVVTACQTCNLRKADRTPEQAGMQLTFEPRVPSPTDVLRMSLRKTRAPTEWAEYLPEGASAWQGYWVDELDED